MEPAANNNGKIILSTTEGRQPISIADIIYCRGDNNYTIFYIAGESKMLMVSITLKQIIVMIHCAGFYRISKSHFVQLAHVKKFLRENGGSVLLHNGEKLHVSRRNRKEFLKVWEAM